MQLVVNDLKFVRKKAFDGRESIHMWQEIATKYFLFQVQQEG
jgi:hypothetical protein